MNELLPTAPNLDPTSTQNALRATGNAVKADDYRPWRRARVWVLFMFGMHAAAFMTFFFNPVFAFLGLAFGLPAVILSGIEMREFPEARTAGPVRWGRITGFVGLIGGPICMVLFGIVIAAFAAFFR